MITISAFADEIGPDLDLQMDTCQAQGIGHIDVRGIDEINVSKMTLAQVKEYKKRLDERGFAVPCIGSPIGKIKISDDFDEHLELLRHCCDVAKAFGTSQIRVFSFYPSPGKRIEDERQAVMDRLEAMVKVAESADAVLLHENERNIYGAKPEGVKDIFATIQSDRLKGIFDPANFVCEDVAPYDDAWTQGLAELTDYFHIKDKATSGEEMVFVPAGEGVGQCEEIFTDLKQRAWSGVMTLEPHMKAGGQFSGFSGPDLFAKAVEGLKGLCNQVGLAYE